MTCGTVPVPAPRRSASTHSCSPGTPLPWAVVSIGCSGHCPVFARVHLGTVSQPGADLRDNKRPQTEELAAFKRKMNKAATSTLFSLSGRRAEGFRLNIIHF